MEPEKLGTLQRNALCRLFGRKDFTPQEVADLDYAFVEQLPKIGKKGIEAIRSWLRGYGYDLNNPPIAQEKYIDKRLRLRLDLAQRLLVRHGYRVDPPP